MIRLLFWHLWCSDLVFCWTTQRMGICTSRLAEGLNHTFFPTGTWGLVVARMAELCLLLSLAIYGWICMESQLLATRLEIHSKYLQSTRLYSLNRPGSQSSLIPWIMRGCNIAFLMKIYNKWRAGQQQSWAVKGKYTDSVTTALWCGLCSVWHLKKAMFKHFIFWQQMK